MSSRHPMTGAIAAAASLCAFVPSQSVVAQSLHGSRASINRMYHQARAARLHFYETSRGVRNAVRAGRLVRLTPDSNFSLHQVGYPYVRPTTRTFLERLGAQYRDACGEQLEVTSAVRPATRQPPNSTARSVHPTGMAVDLHKPEDEACRRWLRETLVELEGAGLLEATEEFAPPHFHVAVYQTPYRRYVAARTAAQHHDVASQDGVASSYRVRAGDTLWAIARAHDTTVDALVSANHLDDDVIQPGQELTIPSGE